MHLNAYQCLASRTIDRKRSTQETLTHSLLGLCAETGELLARYQKHLQGHPLVEDHLKKEAGDVLWMLAEFCTVNNWLLEDIAKMNIEKLKARYPNGFEADKSLHRKEGDI